MTRVANPITTADAAARLGVSVRRVQQFAAAGRIKSMQMGGVLLIDDSSIDEFSRRERSPGRPRKPRESADDFDSVEYRRELAKINEREIRESKNKAHEMANALVAELLSDGDWHFKTEILISIEYGLDPHLIYRTDLFQQRQQKSGRQKEASGARGARILLDPAIGALSRNGTIERDCAGRKWQKIRLIGRRTDGHAQALGAPLADLLMKRPKNRTAK